MNIEITQVLTVFAIVATNLGTVIGLYIHSDNKMEAHRKESAEILNAIRQDMKDFREIWANESRDFHGRLCAIEEKKMKLLER